MHLNKKIPRLVAHRGYMSAYPENTLLGISQAIEHGACFVEFDVQCGRDGELIVHHDATLDRTTGASGRVFERDSSELVSISAHEPDRFGDRFAGEKIPLLSDALALLANSDNCHAFVEIKCESLDHFGMQTVMDRLMQTLHAFSRRCTIITFDAEAIRYAKSRHWTTGWVLNHYDERHKQIARDLHADYLVCDYRKIPPGKPWPGNWQWMLYDIIEADLALEFAAQGVDFIETGDIGSMARDPALGIRSCDRD